MRTGIHFEDGQVYTCYMDEKSTIEQEPVRMQKPWTHYVAEAVAEKGVQGEKIGIVMDGMTLEVMKEAADLEKHLGFTAHGLKLYTKEEALVGLVKVQNNQLDRGNTVIFDYNQSGLCFYQIQKYNGKIRIEKKDYTSEISGAVTKSEKDQAFLKIIKNALAKGVTVTVYLCGTGFDGQWFQDSVKTLCLGRRVFMGKHLFACGAAYLAGEEVFSESREEALILTETMTICQIGLTLHHHGRDVFYPLMKEGRPWFESKGEIEIFVSGINRLNLELRNKSGIKQAMVCFPLTGMTKDKDVVYQLKIEGEYISPDKCKIKIADLGFGEIRPTTFQVWQQVICLERGDFRE